MLIAAFFAWWYGDGWRSQINQIKLSLVKINDTFSIPLLLSTLFAPFRQISAGSVSGSIEVQFRAAIDKLFSRFIGAFMRTIMIFVGIILMILFIIISLIRLMLWPLLPLFPIVGLVLMSSLGTPWI